MKPSRGLMYKVRVKTRSSRPGVEVLGRDELLVRVKAVPERGRANKEVCELLAAHFGLRRQKVSIISGLTSSTKLVFIAVDPSPFRGNSEGKR